MQMPGFTAEASLYKIGRYYRTPWSHVTSNTHVVPAMPTQEQCDYALDKCFTDDVPRHVNRAACHVMGRCGTSSRGGIDIGDGDGAASDWGNLATCVALCTNKGTTDDHCVETFC